jgi:glycerophosphoryl diester phosphodiesterase
MKCALASGPMPPSTPSTLSLVILSALPPRQSIIWSGPLESALALIMRSFQLLGHRGARGLFSENTVAGFAAAFALGVDAVELDVAMTADGVPVVSHEPALRPEITRGPDGHWLETPGPLLHALRFAELRRFDVGGIRPGSSYAAEFPVQAPQDGAHIPSFEEAVSIAPGRFLAELKTFPDRPEITAPAVALAEATVAVSAPRRSPLPGSGGTDPRPRISPARSRAPSPPKAARLGRPTMQT